MVGAPSGRRRWGASYATGAAQARQVAVNQQHALGAREADERLRVAEAASQ